MFVLIYGWGESSVEVALDSKPVVGEIGQGGIRADSRCVIPRRAKPDEGYAQSKLPAEVVAAAIDILWSGRGGQGLRRSHRSRLGEQLCARNARLGEAPKRGFWRPKRSCRRNIRKLRDHIRYIGACAYLG